MDSPQKITRLQLVYLVSILEKEKPKQVLPSGSKGILSFEGEMPYEEFIRKMELLSGKDVSKST